MEGPLLTKSHEHVTTAADSSSDDEHVVNMTADSSSIGEQTQHEVEVVEWQNPCTRENVWGFIDFVLALVQIVAAIVVLTRAKDEHPETKFLVWIIGYTCGCIVTLPLRFLTCCFSGDDKLERMVAYFFVGWVALFSWFYANSSSSLYDNTQHFWLCMAFLAFGCIRYVPAHPKFAAICLICVLILWISALVLGTTPNTIVWAVFLFVALFIAMFTRELIDLNT